MNERLVQIHLNVAVPIDDPRDLGEIADAVLSSLRAHRGSTLLHGFEFSTSTIVEELDDEADPASIPTGVEL